jgi:DNA-binding NtrC family response regulator
MTTHILLIEDDADQRVEIVEYMLRRHHRVTACASVTEAGKALDGAVPDAVVADIQLPDGDGVTFYIDNVRRVPGARWILMSGNHDLVRLANELEAVADLPPCSVVDKPVALRLLDQFILGTRMPHSSRGTGT